MFRSKLFRKHYLFLTGIVLIFILLGFASTQLTLRLVEKRQRPSPLQFFAHVVDDLGPEHRQEMLAKLANWDQQGHMRLLLMDQDGAVLFPTGAMSPVSWNQLEQPANPFEETIFRGDRRAGPPQMELIRLPGAPAQYLALTPNRERGSPIPILAISLGASLLSVILGMGVALFFIFRSIDEKVRLADSVISELQRGNLKARFPIHKMDETGEAMSRFNKMAQEIENLVEQIKSGERSRMALLQELAHDLRTPVASLRHLIETVHDDGATLAPPVREELMVLARKEIQYFERLVEDLLVLAQASEPRYQAKVERVSLSELLEEESDGIQNLTSQGPVQMRKNWESMDIQILGDRHLLRRMIRNVLENALSFAESQVEMNLEITPHGEAKITVIDDGPGFSHEALQTYGERRVTRNLGVRNGARAGRLSVGLGSVIVKTAARLHRGTVIPSNLMRGEKTVGAQILIFLPLDQKT